MKINYTLTKQSQLKWILQIVGATFIYRQILGILAYHYVLLVFSLILSWYYNQNYIINYIILTLIFFFVTLNPIIYIIKVLKGNYIYSINSNENTIRNIILSDNEFFYEYSGMSVKIPLIYLKEIKKLPEAYFAHFILPTVIVFVPYSVFENENDCKLFYTKLNSYASVNSHTFKKMWFYA